MVTEPTAPRRPRRPYRRRALEGGLDKGPAKLRAMLRARRFVQAFMAGPEGVRGNAAQAVCAAGYGSTKPSSAAVRGSILLARPDVQRMIQRHMDRIEATTDRILRETAAVAFADMREIAEWDEEGIVVRSSKLLDDAAAAAVQEVEHHRTAQGTRVHVKLHDKIRGLELLAKLRRAIGDDAPREITLVIGRAGSVNLGLPPGEGSQPRMIASGAAATVVGQPPSEGQPPPTSVEGLRESDASAEPRGEQVD